MSSTLIPALRFDWLTRFYDPVVRLTTREDHFKKTLIEQVQAHHGDRVLDVGVGTATLAIGLADRYPNIDIVGLDGDPQVLSIARRKVAASGRDVTLVEGFAQSPPFGAASFDHAVSSLFFHHLTRTDKLQTLRSLRRLLKPGGQLHIADWGQAQNVAMRTAFLAVQLLDGFETTSDNVRGRLPMMMAQVGFAGIEETHHMMTPLGTMSIFRAHSP